MMNGAKKSDSSIVPAKLANKAERSAAESVEGDDGTKRNAELQSTVRTQSREAVTQAQARIRGAVTRNKKEIRIMAARRATNVTKSFIAQRLTRGRSPVR
jgi:RNA-directed DNA polymerase